MNNFIRAICLAIGMVSAASWASGRNRTFCGGDTRWTKFRYQLHTWRYVQCRFLAGNEHQHRTVAVLFPSAGTDGRTSQREHLG